MPGGNVLLVEDDPALSFAAKYFLTQRKYSVVHCGDAESAWKQFMKSNFDICLIDNLLPGKSGLELAKQIRLKNTSVPILILSAKDSDEDRIAGMESGADCYLPKPYNFEELHMRMQVFLRYKAKKIVPAQNRLRIGGYILDCSGMKLCQADGKYDHDLTEREAELLYYLYINAGRIIKREEILMDIWGKNDQYLGRSLDVFINRLRKYFRTQSVVEIKTIRGIGYKFSKGDSTENDAILCIRNDTF